MILIACGGATRAQSCYWVMLTDKNGTTFDPYSYFDSKAIERYRLNNADLYDISNYPLNESYVQQITAIATEEFGESRWLNAVAVMATPEEIEAIEKLPFVKCTDLIASNMEIAEYKAKPSKEVTLEERDNSDLLVTDQLLRMKGHEFIKKGIDGSGIRIAVFDGGFRNVNVHQAFKHLRDNRRIIATWDFTKKQEDVYDNHGHGTMVLSCIAGKIDDKQLGLATGASFLLAKTEVDPEPFKEEVWWAQAVEWADKNGADIINSSLGYTKDRHYTWEMDGRSYVAKAANIAASKGILVCNSAGNSGDDQNWKIIGTPADAEDILSVGGIESSLTTYSHIRFSSYGPTTDGRMKPNVCNFGHCMVADPTKPDKTTFAYGTSFSSPLTAGFAACAWQTMRDRKAMEMKKMIEQSCDLYPYYDYALGYGVPQATYFTEFQNSNIEITQPTFQFEERGSFVLIRPMLKKKRESIKKPGPLANDDNYSYDVKTALREDVVMFKIQDNNGLIERYVNLGCEDLGSDLCVAIPKGAIWGYNLVAHVNGQTDTYRLSKKDSLIYAYEDHKFEYYIIDTEGYYIEPTLMNTYSNRSLADNETSIWGKGQKYELEYHIQLGGGGMLWSDDDALQFGFTCRTGLRFIRNFRKWYGLGIGLDWGVQELFYKVNVANDWDQALGIPTGTTISDKFFDNKLWNLELFQRIKIKSGGWMKKGLHWDLGVYGGLQYNRYTVVYNENQNVNCSEQVNYYYNVLPAADTRLNWGFTTRIVYDMAGLYARLRMSQPDLNIPRFEFGIQLSF